MYSLTAFVASVERLILFMLSIVLNPSEVLPTPMFAMHIFHAAYILSLAQYYSHPLGVNFLSESIQRDAFFRNVLLDQEQQRHFHQRSSDCAQQILHLPYTLITWREIRFNNVTPFVFGRPF